jgi:hypothetical protein
VGNRLIALEGEIEDLRRSFLPDPFDPLGNYPDPDRVQLQARGFLVLSHAAVETYLEDWAKDIAKAAEAVWIKRQRVAPPLAYLVGSLGERAKTVESLALAGGKDSRNRFADVVLKLFPAFYKRVNENNGIKEKNVLKLFDPLGIEAAAFTATLLPNLDTLGKRRGEHAHYSNRAVKTPLDPETEYQHLQNVLLDLATLEQWLTTYRRSIR